MPSPWIPRSEKFLNISLQTYLQYLIGARRRILQLPRLVCHWQMTRCRLLERGLVDGTVTDLSGQSHRRLKRLELRVTRTRLTG